MNRRARFLLLLVRVALTACMTVGCVESGQVLGPPPESEEPGAQTLAASTVTAGSEHTCALVSGQAVCWGANDDGQLGLDDLVDRAEPEFLTNDHRFEQLAAGEWHTCGIDRTGQVHCWGANARGQLGLGSRDAVTQPELVSLPGRATVLSTRFEHTCAILADQSLYCWGQNYEGQLGQADQFPGRDPAVQRDADQLSPVRVPGAWQIVDTGQGHTCGVRTDGSLWCWGRNTGYELGVELEQVQSREPVRVGPDADWHDVEAGQHYTCATKTDGSLWCWGQNTGLTTDGGLPLGIEQEVITDPTRLDVQTKWSSLAAHTFHTCAVDPSFDLYCWGRTREGQLGVGAADEWQRAPSRVGINFSMVSVGRFFTCGVQLDGVVACTGSNGRGQLGVGDRERRFEFVDVTLSRR